jgi:hypothetical protein
MEATQMTNKDISQLKALETKIHEAWSAACQHERIETSSRFVVFSSTNPNAQRHNELMGQYFNILKRVQSRNNRAKAVR